jgi:hypothetical protein
MGHIRIPLLTGMNTQETRLDKGSFILNLEWKALKIAFKTVIVCVPVIRGNSEEGEETDADREGQEN